MKKIIYQLVICLLVLAVFTSQGLCEEKRQKLAQTGFQFLSVISDARAGAMAGAVNSVEIGSAGLFFNPATMASMTGLIDISASMNTWIADISHYAFSLAVCPASGRYGTFGLSVQHVDYGDLYGTIVSENALGYEDTGEFSPSAMAIGFGYAKRLSDRFSVGGQVKWVHQDLGEAIVPYAEIEDSTHTITNELSPLAFDFGTLFKTGWKSLAFGMSVKHFSQEIEYEQEGFQLPLVFTMGISMDLMDLIPSGGIDQSLYLSIDATHYRSHPEQLLIGLDYRLLNLLSLRGGYISSNDEEDFTCGVGVSYFGVHFDYAYTPFGVFDKVQRMTVRFSL